jgi:hypothetical protein
MTESIGGKCFTRHADGGRHPWLSDVAYGEGVDADLRRHDELASPLRWSKRLFSGVA